MSSRMRKIVVALLLLTPFFAQSQERNPVTERFVDGCMLISRGDTYAIERASSEALDYGVMCGTTVEAALDIARAASTFKYMGRDVCVPPDAQVKDVTTAIVERAAEFPLAYQLKPAQLTGIVLIDRFRCAR